MTEPGPRYDFGIAFLLSGAANLVDFGRRVGMHPKQVHRYASGGFTHQGADKAACRLGWLPYGLWPEWLEFESSSVVVDWRAVRRQALERAISEDAERRRLLRQSIDAETLDEARFRRAKRESLPIDAVGCRSCGEAFVPKVRTQVYCRMSCSERGQLARRAS